MKDLINIMAKRRLNENLVSEYYYDFFSKFDSGDLFEVYDINTEKFISFPGRKSTRVMNRDTLADGLAEMEVNNGSIDGLWVIKHNEHDIIFDEPIFIGSDDSYYAQNGE